MKSNRKIIAKAICVSIALLILSISLLGAVGCTRSGEATPLPPAERLRVATTTSLYDTGLWGYLEPMFEEQYGVELDVMYAGTGKALEYGQRGDVDIITVHSRAREEAFIAEGYGVERVPFAYNYFLIVGPSSDPADIKSMLPEEAFKKLMQTGSGSFVSRGDDSGTHSKEKSIWQKAGYEYETVQQAGTWYIEAGTGMGPTLMMASEKQGYTLTDMGTYLSYQGKLELVPIVDKGDILLNVYSAIAVNPENVKGVKIDLANNLIGFLTSPEIQELIGKYGVEEYGMQLFAPCAGAEPTN
ncbi:MAG: substrate-binding domain-containing protein [Phycisphaerales bacterium]